MSSFGESVSTSPSLMLDQTKFPDVQSFCHLEGDSLGVTGLSYHTETQCKVWHEGMKGSEPSTVSAEDLPGS